MPPARCLIRYCTLLPLLHTITTALCFNLVHNYHTDTPSSSRLATIDDYVKLLVRDQAGSLLSPLGQCRLAVREQDIPWLCTRCFGDKSTGVVGGTPTLVEVFDLHLSGFVAKESVGLVAGIY